MTFIAWDDTEVNSIAQEVVSDYQAGGGGGPLWGDMNEQQRESWRVVVRNMPSRVAEAVNGHYGDAFSHKIYDPSVQANSVEQGCTCVWVDCIFPEGVVLANRTAGCPMHFPS